MEPAASPATAPGVAQAATQGLHRAKQWQIALFPLNNAATNLYFAFVQFFTFFAVMYLTGSTFAAVGAVAVGVLGIQTFVAVFAPMMRILDGATDVVIGGLMDRTKTRFGKFRPFMVLGNFSLAFSVIFMILAFIWIPDSASWARWLVFIVGYILFVTCYSFQTAVTRAGQSCLTNDPKQRSQFGLWNTVGMLGSIVLVNVVAMGLLPAVLSDTQKGTINYIDASGVARELFGSAYGPTFYFIMVPLIVVLSAVYTFLAVLAIKDKDKPEFWGASKDPVKVKDYLGVVKGNKELRWLVLSAGFNKLGSTIATSAAVAFLLFGALMGDYNGLFIPFYVLCFIFMGGFLAWGAKTGGRKGQKRAVTQFALIAFLFYIGVTVMLSLYQNGNEWVTLSFFNPKSYLYTGLFIILYGCGYGAFNVTDQMTIPMVADIIDYETYRSGKYVPGIVSTMFSFIDKLISSLQVLLLTVFIVYMVPGLEALPVENTKYMPGMELAAIITFCLIPMATWLITLFCMTRYKLSGKKIAEVQAVNAVRKAAVQGGMGMEQAMATWQTIDQVPAEFIPVKKPRTDKKTGAVLPPLQDNFLDKLYKKVWTRNEAKIKEPSVNAVPIPEEFTGR